MVLAAPPPSRRPFPRFAPIQEPYWAAGADGVLRMQRCEQCRHVVHPAAVLCPWDHHGELRWEDLSGRGTVESWTESRYTWVSGVDAPYVIALVTIDEDPTARILTNVVGLSGEEMEIGMPVEVCFERLTDGDDVAFLPLFRPVATS